MRDAELCTSTCAIVSRTETRQGVSQDLETMRSEVCHKLVGTLFFDPEENEHTQSFFGVGQTTMGPYSHAGSVAQDDSTVGMQNILRQKAPPAEERSPRFAHWLSFLVCSMVTMGSAVEAVRLSKQS